MDTEALPAALKKPLVLLALEELKMLTQDHLERERYEARRKAQLDYNTGLKAARLEGQAEGEKRGFIRIIHLCESWLNRPETPAENLAILSLEDLTRLANDLQAQAQKQR
jgi:hypothetical protein